MFSGSLLTVYIPCLQKNFTLVAILPAEPLDDYLFKSCF